MIVVHEKERMSAESFRAHGGNTPAFSLDGVQTWVRVVDIYDGDTLTVVIPCFGGFYKFSVRMGGIDTCEIRSKLKANKDKAYAARDRVIQCITKNERKLMTKKEIQQLLDSNVYLVWAQCKEFDKYGRLLANIYVEQGGETLSDILIREKLAYAYEGDTKLTEEEQLVKLM
jgi:endonuclease YncB( thermonuclease family)